MSHRTQQQKQKAYTPDFEPNQIPILLSTGESGILTSAQKLNLIINEDQNVASNIFRKYEPNEDKMEEDCGSFNKSP